MTQHITLAAGIDTAKHKLDAAIHGHSARLTVENRKPGWQQLAGALAAAGVKRVGIEATGGYERGGVGYLRARGFTLPVLQPLQVKAYARLHLRRAKNDTLDAVMIAACAATLEAPQIAPDPRLPSLSDALTFVEQGEEDIARCKTRLEHITQPRLRRLVLADIARLQRRRTAAFRWNSALVTLYHRLIAKQKAHKLALIACARKLLIYANTGLQRGSPWLPQPAAS